MENWTQRTEILVGGEKAARLARAHVVIVGVGGVGGMAAEMICRAGVGRMTLVDADTVGETNLNRQIVASRRTLGMLKTDAFAERLLSVNPALQLEAKPVFLDGENIPQLFSGEKIDFVVDAIDTIAPKIALIKFCLQNGIPVISSMGSGAKTDITKIGIADISKTYNCRLARSVRQRLAKDGIRSGLPVVFSSELPDPAAVLVVNGERNKKSTTGTISYMPNAFGCFISAYVLQRL